MEDRTGGVGAPGKGESPLPKAAEQAASHDVDDFPDPDEDDLDDLDDMLDEFSAAKPAPSKEPETASGPGRPGGAVEDEPGLEGELSDEEFAQQLQAGMADLLGEIENTPEVQAQFETIFKEIGAAAADAAAAAADETPSGPSAEPSRGAAGVNAEASFQETIRKTMERMQTSGDKATAAAAAGDGSDDLLAELMKQMQAGGLEAEGGEEDFSKMLLGMMEQLTNKEILYEPMKELADKYPAWLEKNRSSLPADDLRRYEEQQGLAQEMVAKFEEAAYSDTNAQDREYIVERMHKMQAAGSPPADLVGDMESAQEALSAPDESCNPQ